MSRYGLLVLVLTSCSLGEDRRRNSDVTLQHASEGALFERRGLAKVLK